jgi:2-polyprenyl-3-methyl-5-hydroxy-6-metoxy-1,4-benzoquinol methylase
MMRYYEPEHFDAYAQIKAEGLEQWSDLHADVDGLHDFPNRSFLERVLPPLTQADVSRVLEYGCGTGPAACFLAERGYDVLGIDLVPDAIDIARRHAVERELSVRFDVQDICLWNEEPEQYDVILDSFCLQSIVLDDDRARVLDGVRRRLEPGGRYVLSTAMYEPDRDYRDDHYDRETGIVLMPTAQPHADARRIGQSWYLPHRRHLTAAALRRELESHGYRLVEQSSGGGDIVCLVENP